MNGEQKDCSKCSLTERLLERLQQIDERQEARFSVLADQISRVVMQQIEELLVHKGLVVEVSPGAVGSSSKSSDVSPALLKDGSSASLAVAPVEQSAQRSEALELLQERSEIHGPERDPQINRRQKLQDSSSTASIQQEHVSSVPDTSTTASMQKEADEPAEAKPAIRVPVDSAAVPPPSNEQEAQFPSEPQHNLHGPGGPIHLSPVFGERTLEHAKQHLQHIEREYKIETSKIEMIREKDLSRNKSFIAGKLTEDAEEQRKHSSLIVRVVKGHAFDVGFGLLIFFSAVLTGAEADYAARNLKEEPPVVFDVLNLFFCLTFFLELTLRMYVWRELFFCGKDWHWNGFDFFIVMCSVGEEIGKLALRGAYAQRNSNVKLMRGLRLLRLVRVTRVLRALRFLDELRLMVMSILNSARSLMWTCCLLLLLLFLNGVYITQVVTDYRFRAENGELQEYSTATVEDLETYYGDLWLALYSLYKGVSGGADWGDICEPLEEISWLFLPYFCFLIALVCWCFLNVVTGIFVENALKTAENDRDYMIQEEIAKRHSYVLQLEVIFREADADENGSLSLEELRNHLEDSRVNAYLDHLGIDSTSAEALFFLLDEHGQGKVTISEFVQGCSRLKGEARSIDVAMNKFEARKHWQDIRKMVEASSNHLFARLREVDLSLRSELKHIQDNGGVVHKESRTPERDSDRVLSNYVELRPLAEASKRESKIENLKIEGATEQGLPPSMGHIRPSCGPFHTCNS